MYERISTFLPRANIASVESVEACFSSGHFLKRQYYFKFLKKFSSAVYELKYMKKITVNDISFTADISLFESVIEALKDRIQNDTMKNSLGEDLNLNKYQSIKLYERTGFGLKAVRSLKEGKSYLLSH